MSYKNPSIPTLTLKGLDKKIQEIQILVAAGFSWLGKSFGLADRIVEYRDGNPYIYPATFESNIIDPIPLMPSDAWLSYCFWTSGDSDFELNINFPPKNPIITVPVSCIFYMDVRRVDDVFSYKGTKTKLREDIFNFFNKIKIDGMLIQTSFIEDDITRIFRDFSIDQVDNKFKMYPKWACRMDFELSYRDACYTSNSYTGDSTGVTGTVTVDGNLITWDNG